MSRTKNRARKNRARENRAAAQSAMDIDTPAAQDAAPAADAAAHASAILHSKHAGGGISKPNTQNKPKSKTKRLKHAQRVRREKGQERATAVSEQLAQKVGDSKGRGRKVRDRRRDWADVNGGAVVAAAAEGAGAGVAEDKGVKEARKRERKAAKRARVAELKAQALAGPPGGGDDTAGGVEDSMLDASFVTAREGVESEEDDIL